MCIHKEISLQVTNKLPLLSQISFPKLPSKWAPSWRHFRKKRGFCLGWVYLEILGFHVYGIIVFENKKLNQIPSLIRRYPGGQLLAGLKRVLLPNGKCKLASGPEILDFELGRSEKSWHLVTEFGMQRLQTSFFP